MLIEENLKTVRFVEVSQTLLNIITNVFPMKTVDVFYDDELKESFEIECFDNTDIEGIIEELKENFCKLLSYEYKKLITNDSAFSIPEVNSESLIAEILPEEDHINQTELAIARFHILTGVIGLFIDKQTKLSDEAGAIIKLGD